MIRKKAKGIITKYDPQKKFGFIKAEDRQFYYFPSSNLMSRFPIEENSTEVLFVPSQNSKGLVAKYIEKKKIEIEGRFAYVPFSNTKIMLTNSERREFLKEQHKKIVDLLQSSGILKCGIRPVVNQGWISLQLDTWDSHMFNDDASTFNKIYNEEVPSGYRNTSNHLIELLEKQLKHFNLDVLGTARGFEGEKKTIKSIRAVSLDSHVLQNIRIEFEGMSFESDVIVLTKKVIFIIETKNWGGKNCSIEVTPDGRWSLYNQSTHKQKSLDNPYKQITDHELALEKLLRENNISVPIVGVIAIANDDVNLNISNSVVSVPPVIRSDMLGRFILDYMRNVADEITIIEFDRIKNVISNASLPPQKYPTIDYYDNIKKVCDMLIELREMWEKDCNQKKEQYDTLDYELERIYARNKLLMPDLLTDICSTNSLPLMPKQRESNDVLTSVHTTSPSSSSSRCPTTPSYTTDEPAPSNTSTLDFEDIVFDTMEAVDNVVTDALDGVSSIADAIFSSIINFLN